MNFHKYLTSWCLRLTDTRYRYAVTNIRGFVIVYTSNNNLNSQRQLIIYHVPCVLIIKVT